MTTNNPLVRIGLLLALPALFIFSAGCDTLVDGENGEDPPGHPDLAQLELLDRNDAQRPVVATWTEDEGWDVDQLVLDDLLHGRERASIGLIAVDGFGNELELEEGGEKFMTYVVPTGAPEGVINTELDDETLFHGDHAHIYPQSEGETEIEFLLWHVDHVDDATTPLTIVVVEVPTENDNGNNDE